MAAIAMNLLPMFLGGGGGGGLSGILGNVTGAFGGLISGIGNTLTGMGGGNTQPVIQKSNKKIYFVIGITSVVMVLGIVIIIAKKK